MDDVRDLEGRLNVVLLQALQMNTSYQIRPKVAPLFANVINEMVSRDSTLVQDPQIRDRASSLMRDGCVNLGSVFSAQQAAQIFDFFATRPCFNAHVPVASDGIPRHIGSGAETFPYGSHLLEDVVAAPLLLELANSREMLGIAEQYLECTPTLYSLHAWWSFSGVGKAPTAQEFHRDPDDYKFCTLFVFLTDVGPTNGAHQFIRHSHQPDSVDSIVRAFNSRSGRNVNPADLFSHRDDGYGRDELYEDIFSGRVQTITGPAGHAFIADTSGLHRGVPLAEGRRLMFWARYGLFRNYGLRLMKTDPVPRSVVAHRVPLTPRSAYINRCILA